MPSSSLPKSERNRAIGTHESKRRTLASPSVYTHRIRAGYGPSITRHTNTYISTIIALSGRRTHIRSGHCGWIHKYIRSEVLRVNTYGSCISRRHIRFLLPRRMRTGFRFPSQPPIPATPSPPPHLSLLSFFSNFLILGFYFILIQRVMDLLRECTDQNYYYLINIGLASFFLVRVNDLKAFQWPIWPIWGDGEGCF